MTTLQYLLSAWRFDPIAIGSCFAALVAFPIVVDFRWSARSWCFCGGLLVFILALASPLDALARGHLFSAHMLQHMLLLLVVPVLLLLGVPCANGRTDHLRVRRLPAWPCWLGGVGTMWLWHERTLCDLATTTETFRNLQVVTSLGLGTLFWWPLFGYRAQQRLSPLSAVVYLFAACIACSLLGVLITFLPNGGVCPIYSRPSAPSAITRLIRDDWGITPAVDQQVGGLLMWVPGCALYLGFVMAMLGRWYRTEGSESPRPRAGASRGDAYPPHEEIA